MTIINGDCVEEMKKMDANSVDAIVCDPPYGLEFMGKKWDSLDVRQPDDETFHKSGVGPFDRAKVRYSSAPSYGGGAGNGMQEWHYQWAVEALRVAKPGAHLVAFGGTRTYHRLTCALEDAGWEIRDSLMWLYGTGFPKSMDVSKQLDKKAGAKRKVVGQRKGQGTIPNDRGNWGLKSNTPVDVTEPATNEAKEWNGWGTALKPAWEPIILARKPLEGTVAANVTKYTTGAINIDGTRIPTNSAIDDARLGGNGKWKTDKAAANVYEGGYAGDDIQSSPLGRWPANFVLSHTEECKVIGTTTVDSGRSEKPSDCDTEGTTSFDQMRGQRPPRGYGEEVVEQWECSEECPVKLLDEQSGKRNAGHFPAKLSQSRMYGQVRPGVQEEKWTESGGASRFFYTAKASRSEREAGLEGLPEKLFGQSGGAQGALERGNDEYIQKDTVGLNRIKSVRNNHPTVKPIELMKWLCTLVTPPKGTILDPFCGSGTTGCAARQLGFTFIGIEREAEYIQIAEKRIAYWTNYKPKQKSMVTPKPNDFFGDK